MPNPVVARFTATHSTAITICEVTNTSTKVLEVLRAWVTQETVTATGQAGILLLRKTATITGTTLTPVSLNSTAATITAKHTATGEGTDGNVLIREGFNIVNGWLYLPVPEERVVVPPSGMIALKFGTAPASASYSYGILVHEIG